MGMKENTKNHEKSSSLAIELLGSEEAQAEWNMKDEGSNMLILPGMRSKSKGKGKPSRGSNTRSSPTISKSQQRKLQNLQKKKEEKLMLSESIKTLQKYKMSDDAYSLLQSAATIGKAKTYREKCRLHVQYSKLGLEVPDDLSFFKKKAKASYKNDDVENTENHEKVSNRAIDLLRSEVQAERNVKEEGSNMLISPEKRSKSNGKGEAKTHGKKRRLDVQHSELGLDVPDDVSLFTKKVKTTYESDVVVRPSVQGDQVVCSDRSLRLMQQLDKDDCLGSTSKKLDENLNCSGASHVKFLKEEISKTSPVTYLAVTVDSARQCPLQSHLASTSKSTMNSAESTVMFLSHEGVEKANNQFVHAAVKNVMPKSFITGNQNNSSLQGAEEVTKNIPKLEAMHFSSNVHVNPAIVVHVSRPHEVEEKRKDLPIIMMEQEIMEAINEHPILILCGETGCGKTTQVPQFLYEAGYGSSKHNDRKGIICITQPRRVAVLATAERVSYEMGLKLGKEVGFQVRHDKMIGNDCSIKFMTDGILLRELQSDLLLRQYSVIILDEAHERTLNTDILIGMLSRIIKTRNGLYEDQQQKILSGVKISPENLINRLKLVLMSATMRIDDFVSNKKLFQEPPPVLEVPVRQFPVTIHFSRKTPEDYIGQAYKKVLSIHKRLPPGGILVFVTGQKEVEYLCKKLRKASQKYWDNGVKKMHNQTPAGFELDMKEIDDAFWAEDNFSNKNIDRFCSYEEDGFEESDKHSEYSSESEADSESVGDSEDECDIKCEEQVGNGSGLDFLDNPESLASLRDAFQALAGNIPNKSAEEKPGVQSISHIKESSTKYSAVVAPLYVLPLYAMLPASAQLGVFEKVPEGERLVIVSTNVAETSLTIPGIKYVVDTGKEKVKFYNHSNGMASFEVNWISKASAAQRAGRAGRTAPGHCYRLYSSAAFGKDDVFPKFSYPEISKIPVDGVVLLMKSFNIHKVENFPFPTPLNTPALEEASRCLKAIEALDEKGRLTSLGRAMAHYPMGPRHSRMIITMIQSLRNQCGFTRTNLVLGYAVAAAAALSFPDPFLMQYGGIEGTTKTNMDHELKNYDEERSKDKHEKLKRKKIATMLKESRARFCNPNSDALTIAYALQLFDLAGNKFEFCTDNSLHLKTMEEMSKLRKQVLHLIFQQQKCCNEFSWDGGSFKDVEGAWLVHSSKHPLQLNEEELLAQAICAGWADRVAKRIRTVSASSDKEHKVHAVRYQSCAMNDTIYLHHRSSVSRTAPEFVVYNELLCTNRPYMHGVTAVKSDWLLRYANSLCCFSSPLADPKPYYDPLSDGTFCWVNPTFGRHNWNLPLHSIPIKNEDLRISVFACALLEGNVLPCLKSLKNLLAATPSIILRPEGLVHRRVVDLLRRLKMGPRTVDSLAILKEIWSENPRFLHPELQCWFQKSVHSQFDKIWDMCIQEGQLEGLEFFPKWAKKDRKVPR